MFILFNGYKAKLFPKLLVTIMSKIIFIPINVDVCPYPTYDNCRTMSFNATFLSYRSQLFRLKVSSNNDKYFFNK